MQVGSKPTYIISKIVNIIFRYFLLKYIIDMVLCQKGSLNTNDTLQQTPHISSSLSTTFSRWDKKNDEKAPDIPLFAKNIV